MDKKVRRRIFERFTREQLIDMLINEKIKNENYRTSINNLVNKLKESDKVIKEVREYIEEKPLYHYVYDEEEFFPTISEEKARKDLLQILDKAKDSD